MPQQKRPIVERPKVEDESTGRGTEQHGKHREDDEALAGRGSSKGGLNRDAGRSREGRPTRGTPGESSRRPAGQP